MFETAKLLLVCQFLQSSDGRLCCDCRRGIAGQGDTSCRFHAGTTVADPHSPSLPLGFATEGTSVHGVTADFNFLHHFPEGGTITGPVFTDNSNLGAFSYVAAN